MVPCCCCSCAGVLAAADGAALQVVQGSGRLAQAQNLALHRTQQLLPVQGALDLRQQQHRHMCMCNSLLGMHTKLFTNAAAAGSRHSSLLVLALLTEAQHS
jgi:hypothetical protein